MRPLYYMIIVFTALLFIGQSFGDEDDEEKKESSESDSESNIQKIKNKLRSGLAKLNELKKKVVPAKLLPKETHPTIWDKFADTLVDELRIKLSSTCVPGVRLENTKAKEVLTLSKGKLTGINQVYHRNDAGVVTETGDTAGVEINFAFRNLKIEFFYEYEAKHLIFPLRKRRGPVFLQVDGVAVYSVILDAQKLTGDSSDKSKQCYLNVKKTNLKEVPNKVRLLRVHSNNIITRTFYFIFKYLNFTVRGITSSVKVVQQQLLKYVGEALEDAVEKGVRSLKGVCPLTVAKKKTARDCQFIKPMLY